jgi:hypothetical protein
MNSSSPGIRKLQPMDIMVVRSIRDSKLGMNIMADQKSKGLAKVKKKVGAKQDAAAAAKPGKERLPPAEAGQPALLSGGNPQIAKGYGDAPVQAYIAAMPGWKRDVGRHLDALVVRTVPDVQKAVKWNSPFYGVEGQGWFLSLHCFTNYIKVAFFRGASLRPVPPEASKHEDVRYVHLREGEPLDEAQFVDWVKQASQLPGEKM